MKRILNITDFINRLNEKNETPLFPLFKNESELKDILINDKSFIDGDVRGAISNIFYTEWQTAKKDKYHREDMLNWFKNNYGMMPYFCVLFGSYDGQVCNGGHSQYFGNGYASSKSRGFSHDYTDIDTHEEMVILFKDFDLNNILLHGKEAYNIMSAFELDLDERMDRCGECGGDGIVLCSECDGDGEIDCRDCGGTGQDDDVDCDTCDGSGKMDCPECSSKGEITCQYCDGKGEEASNEMEPNTTIWDKLDTRWGNINEEIMEEFNEYLKSLTLHGETIRDLVAVASSVSTYNV